MQRYGLALLVVILVPLAAWGQTTEEKQATIAYLQACQHRDGGFFPSRPGKNQNATPKSSLRASSAALRALKYFGGEAKDREACAKFIASCFDKASGGFADHPGGQIDAATTAIGLLAVVEAKLPVKDYRAAAIKYLGEKVKGFDDIRIAAAAVEAVKERTPQADTWLEQIAQMRNKDGTYGKGNGVARATGGAAVAVLRLGGKVEQRDNVVQALKKGQRDDGGFGKEDAKTSDLETSYRVMRAFHMLREKPDVERCRAFIAKCRNADGGYGVEPGKPSTVGATYYAAIILHWMAET
jgi:prenyltransferase beta subunit